MSTWTDLIATFTGQELWWRLGEGSGTTATDSSGNARHGTYHGTPEWDDGSICNDADLAYYLSQGTNDDYADIASAGWMDTRFLGTYTAFALFRTSSIFTRRMFGRFNNLAGDSLTTHCTVVMFGGGEVGFYTASQADANALISPGTYNDGRWHLLGVERDASSSPATLRMYADGAFVGSKSEPFAPVSTTYPLSLGWDGGDISSNKFFGWLDEFMIWSRTFTAAEHAALYDASVCRGEWVVDRVAMTA